MPKVKANDITMNYESQGAASRWCSSPISPPTTPATPFRSPITPSISPASRSIRAAPARPTSRPATYSMELFADDVAAFMQAIGVERAHVSGLSLGAATASGSPANIRNGSNRCRCTSCWPKSDPFLKVVVGRLADDRQRPRQRPGNDHSGNLSLVLHARALRRQARLYRPARGLRAQPSEAAVRRLHPPVERGHRSRRARPARQDLGADPDHLRPPRHRDLAPLRRAVQARNQGQRNSSCSRPAPTQRFTKA